MRARPLPPDTLVVIFALQPGAPRPPVRLKRTPARLLRPSRRPALLYQKVLFVADSCDCHRIWRFLQAPHRCVSTMRWLMSWLHPDRNRQVRTGEHLCRARARCPAGSLAAAGPPPTDVRTKPSCAAEQPQRRRSRRASRAWVPLPLELDRAKRRRRLMFAALILVAALGLALSSVRAILRVARALNYLQPTAKMSRKRLADHLRRGQNALARRGFR